MTGALAVLLGLLLELGLRLNGGGYNGGGVEADAADVFVPWGSLELYLQALLNALLVFALLMLLWRALDWIAGHRLAKAKVRQSQDAGAEQVPKFRDSSPSLVSQPSSVKSTIKKRWIWICFVGFLLCWSVFWLALWPGIFNYDAQVQYEMLTYSTLESHHPVLHTLLLDGLVIFGQRCFGDVNTGVALYVGLQLLVMSGVFTLMLRTLAEEGAGKALLGFSFLFLAVNPAVVLWLLPTTKDVLFTGFALLVVLLIYRAMRTSAGTQAIPGRKTGGDSLSYWSDRGSQDKEDKRPSPASLRLSHPVRLPGLCFLLALAVLTFLMLAFRTSAVFSFVLFLPFALLLLRKYLRIRLMASLLVGLGLFITASLVISSSFGVQPGPWQSLDALSIQRQQLARTWILTNDPEDIAQYKQVFSQQDIENLYRYQADDADTSRSAFREPYENNFSELLNLYLSQGQKHPDIYLDAALLTSYEAWFPGAVVDGYVMDGYHASPDVAWSSYAYVACEWPASANWQIPALANWLEQFGFGNVGNDNIVARLLCSPAVFIWILLVALARSICVRSRRNSLICLFLLLLGATALLSPIVVVRYYLPVIFSLPLLLHLLSNTGLALKIKCKK